MTRWSFRFAIAACTIGTPLSAQIITGRVADATTGSGLGAALVLAVSAEGDTLQAMTRTDGTFGLGARPGTWRVSAARIGYAWPSGVLATVPAAGSVRVEITMEVRAIPLGSLATEGERRCQLVDAEGSTQTLWQEARKTLEAVAWAQAEPLTFRLVQREGPVDLAGRAITRASVDTLVGTGMRPFLTPPAAELHASGYIQAGQGAGYAYYAPDAEVLLSDDFLATHCFSARPPEGGRVGLSFRPVQERDVPDVLGTLWLDAATGALLSTEFSYTSDPLGGNPAQLGGFLRFEQLPSGHWITAEWLLRTPRMTGSNAVGGRFRDGRMIGFVEAKGVLLSAEDPRTAVAHSGVAPASEVEALEPDTAVATPAPAAVPDAVLLVVSLRHDPTGEPMQAAAVQLLRAGTENELASAISDSTGQVTFRVPPHASYEVAIRPGLDAPAIKSRPFPVATAPKLVRIAVPALDYRLADIVVEATAEPVNIAAGFNERRRLGFGHQIDRAEIERRSAHDLLNILRTVPGVRLNSVRTADGGREWVLETGRANAGDCRMQVYINGARMSSLAGDPGLLDDLLRTYAADIEAVEVYRGPAETPEVFGGSTARCGVVAIWYRRGGP